jgi:hypothetical protein
MCCSGCVCLWLLQVRNPHRQLLLLLLLLHADIPSN